MKYLKGGQIIIRNDVETRHERSKTIVTGGVSGAGDSRQCSTPEVPSYEEETNSQFLQTPQFNFTVPQKYSRKLFVFLATMQYLWDLSSWTALLRLPTVTHSIVPEERYLSFLSIIPNPKN